MTSLAGAAALRVRDLEKLLHKERVRRARAIAAEQARTREAIREAKYWRGLYQALTLWRDCPYCGVHTPGPTCPSHRDLIGLDPHQ